MNELKNEFIRRSTAELVEIRRRLSSLPDENLTDNFRREIFRRLHTIKGTAQAFNFLISARLAHALENLISAAGEKRIHSINSDSADSQTLLSEGLLILETSLQTDDFQIPADFAEKLTDLLLSPDTLDSPGSSLPAEITDRLSADEAKRLCFLETQGSNLIVLEVGFPLAEFAGKFRAMRRQLEETGEVLAVLSDSKFAAENKIGFQVIFAANNFSEETIKNTGAVIIFRSPRLSDDLQGVLSKVAAYGKMLAENLKKDCQFLISAAPLELSAERLKLIFDILLHLVRNAVDHGIGEKGKIEIGIKVADNGLFLTAVDDGRGIDIDKIRSAATTQKLIETGQQITDKEIINLIFAPGLTTAEKLSEISGRGTGLDAVKTLVESAGGTIAVKNAESRGTIFEIFLPGETLTG